MAKVENIVLNTLLQTKNSVLSQLQQLNKEKQNLVSNLEACEMAIAKGVSDITLIDSSITLLQEPVKISKKKKEV